jgi:hypothetical protein
LWFSSHRLGLVRSGTGRLYIEADTSATAGRTAGVAAEGSW